MTKSYFGLEVIPAMAVSGQMDGENVAEFKTLISSETNGRGIVLDLRDLRSDGSRFGIALVLSTMLLMVTVPTTITISRSSRLGRR
jgi:anti-anti-sigma regulatory factor